MGLVSENQIKQGFVKRFWGFILFIILIWLRYPVFKEKATAANKGNGCNR